MKLTDLYLVVSPLTRLCIISDNLLRCYEMRRRVVSCTLTKHFRITCCIHPQGSWIWRQQVSLKRWASPAARLYIQKKRLLQYLRLSQRCCWRIVFSGMWRCVTGPAVPGVSRYRSYFTCKDPAWPWRWTCYSRSKHREMPVQWQSATFLMTWRVVVTAMWTPDFSDQLRALQIWNILVRYGQYLRFHKERLCLIPYVVLIIRKSVRGCSVLTVLQILLKYPKSKFSQNTSNLLSTKVASCFDS
jgi:hypothetical protein